MENIEIIIRRVALEKKDKAMKKLDIDREDLLYLLDKEPIFILKDDTEIVIVFSREAVSNLIEYIQDDEVFDYADRIIVGEYEEMMMYLVMYGVVKEDKKKRRERIAEVVKKGL